MNTFKEALKVPTKIEWVVSIGGIAFFEFLYHFSGIPRYMVDPLFYAFASGMCIYSCFFRKNSGTIKNRLYGAMFAGAFTYLFIESVSKLFAKWAVWKFF